MGVTHWGFVKAVSLVIHCLLNHVQVVIVGAIAYIIFKTYVKILHLLQQALLHIIPLFCASTVTFHTSHERAVIMSDCLLPTSVTTNRERDSRHSLRA